MARDKLPPMKEWDSSHEQFPTANGGECLSAIGFASGELGWRSLSQLVSIHKWPIPPISASIIGIPCATYISYVSAQSLDFLDLDEIFSFLNWKHSYVPMVKRTTSWMGTS